MTQMRLHATPECAAGAEVAIIRAGIELRNLSSYLKGVHVETKDPRALRAELMLEELGESLEALAKGHELALLDGLADLLYVTFGTATTFDLPATLAFQEVHRSNMTKSRRLDHAAGVTGKGPQFRPPDLRRVLNQHRGREVCAVCSYASGELRQQASGGMRAVVLMSAGGRTVCTACAEADAEAGR